MRNDRGGVIVGYFTKIALVLVVFSVICFDVVSVGAARVGVEDTARSAAMAASETYNTSRDADYALRIASEYAEEHGTTVTDFSIADDGTVTVRVEKEATTLLLYRTKKTSSWAHVSASGSGRAV